METTQLAKETLNFQKNMFDNYFNAMIQVQDQAEKMYSSSIEIFPWATEENKNAMESSVKIAKQIRDSFQTTVEDGFTLCEQLLDNNK